MTRLSERITGGRGFQRVERDQSRLVQQSSGIGPCDDAFDRPGSSYLWIGDNHHLDREQVRELVEMMQCWLDTGYLWLAEGEGRE